MLLFPYPYLIIPVFYDNFSEEWLLSDVAYDSWKASFDSLGVPVRYMQMATNPSRIRAQLNALRNQAKTIVFVAKTENIEKFIVEVSE